MTENPDAISRIASDDDKTGPLTTAAGGAGGAGGACSVGVISDGEGLNPCLSGPPIDFIHHAAGEQAAMVLCTTLLTSNFSSYRADQDLVVFRNGNAILSTMRAIQRGHLVHLEYAEGKLIRMHCEPEDEYCAPTTPAAKSEAQVMKGAAVVAGAVAVVLLFLAGVVLIILGALAKDYHVRMLLIAAAAGAGIAGYALSGAGRRAPAA